MSPNKIYLDSPLYVGMSVLEISKYYMYSFHYDRMKKWFPNIEVDDD